MKGSQRHMLDLVSQTDSEARINDLLEDTGFQLSGVTQPCGHGKDERKENAVETFLKTHEVHLASGDRARLPNDWWRPFGGKGPTLDLLAELSDGVNPALLLVEAKAHEAELKNGSKKKLKKPTPKKLANDFSIRLRLSQQSRVLTWAARSDFGLSADHNYQLSNRLAYASKLAEEGADVVLLYLGFLHSDDVKATRPLTSDNQWRQLVRDHLDSVGTSKILDQRLEIGAGSMQMITRTVDTRDLETCIGETDAG